MEAQFVAIKKQLVTKQVLALILAHFLAATQDLGIQHMTTPHKPELYQPKNKVRFVTAHGCGNDECHQCRIKHPSSVFHKRYLILHVSVSSYAN